MRNENDSLLNDVLVSWHKWACGYQHVGGINSSPMFRDAKTSKGWDSLSDITDDTLSAATCEAVDFHVMQLAPMYRTALQLKARNLATGLSVWNSPRLPACAEERAIVLIEACNLLTRRLLGAGVV